MAISTSARYTYRNQPELHRTHQNVNAFTGDPEYPYWLLGRSVAIADHAGDITSVSADGQYFTLTEADPGLAQDDDGTTTFRAPIVRVLFRPPGWRPAPVPVRQPVVSQSCSRKPDQGRTATNLVVGFTGHANIEKALGLPCPDQGSRYNPTAFQAVYRDIATYLEETFCPRRGVNLEELTLVSGMARGVDEVVARYAMDKSLPLLLCVPNSVKWHRRRPASRGMRAQALHYDEVLAYDKLAGISEIPRVHRGRTYPHANAARNQAIVNRSHWVLSWRRHPSNGTDDCIRRATAAGRYGGNVPRVAGSRQG